MSEDRIKPFSNGSEFSEWTSDNCNQCLAQGDPDVNPLDSVPHDACVLEAALGLAYIGDGKMARRSVELIGCDGLWPQPCTLRHHKTDPSLTRTQVLARINAAMEAPLPPDRSAP